MTDNALDIGLGALAFARKVTLGLLETIPEDQLCHQPVPGANHALWVMGHIAVSDAFFLETLAGRKSPRLDRWRDLFFMGSVAKPNLSDYPPTAEIRDFLEVSRTDLVDWFKSLDASKLMTPLPDDLQPFAPTHAGLMPSIAWHEGLHAGQLTVIRKSLGIAPVFG